MKYWVYINEKVDGPYDGEKLVTLQGFTPDTLICSEEAASNGSQQWVKASSVFEFEQEPTEDQKGAQNGGLDAAAAAVLLEKLDLLTKEITDLHSKLDNMETHIDKAIEQSRVQQALPQVVAAETAGTAEQEDTASVSEETPVPSPEDKTNTQPEETPLTETETKEDATPNQTDVLDSEQTPALAADDMLEEKTSAEEELVIRSALDSLYNAKLLDEQDAKENTFQDLLTPQQAKDLAAEAEKAQQPASTEDDSVKEESESQQEAVEDLVLEDLTETKPEDEKSPAPEEVATVQEVTEEPAKEETTEDQPVVAEEPAKEETAETQPEEANTPVFEEISDVQPEVTEEDKEAFIDTFNQEIAQQSESALDQLLQEKQEEQQKDGLDIAPIAAAAVGAAAVAGLATLDTDSTEQPAPEETPFVPQDESAKVLDLTPEEEPVAIAPDKDNPSQLETVLPADEMPQDNPQPDVVPMEQPADLPSLQEEPLPPINPEQEPESVLGTPELGTLGGDDFSPEQVNVAQEEEDVLQELVPGAKTEAPTDQIITEEDLREAFTERIPAPGSETDFGNIVPDNSSAAEPASETTPLMEALQTHEIRNPNELTEVELKAGSTYLISDFVPPATTEEEKSAPVEEQEQVVEDKTTEIQDMLSAAPEVPADGDIANMLQTAKRGASFDIKTVPMVQDPSQSERLQIEGFDDINAQHDIKSADTKSSGATKVVMGTLVTFALVAVLYVLLSFMHIIPQQFNMLFKEKPAAAAPVAQVQEILQSEEQNTTEQVSSEEETAAPAEPHQPAEPLSTEEVLSEVQQFILPNGQSLQSLIETKHAAVAPELITWDISTAVEPDNYSVLVKVPPENPQSFKTSYRFNYNPVTKTLDPTISDAKNLLDSALKPAQ